MLHLSTDNYGLRLSQGKTGSGGGYFSRKTISPTKEATTKVVMESGDFMISTKI
jgi:hypothetical protein